MAKLYKQTILMLRILFCEPVCHKQLGRVTHSKDVGRKMLSSPFMGGLVG